MSALLLTLFATSCKEDLLNTAPANAQSEADFFSKTGRQQEILTAAYKDLVDNNFLGGSVQTINEVWSDNVYVAPGTSYITYYNHILGDIFNDAFNGAIMGAMGRACRDANYAIYGVEKYGTKLGEGDKKRIVAEAKFIRAVAHFETVRVFAQPYGSTANSTHPGIAIRNSWEVTVVPRASVADVYSFIESNLRDAIADLPATSSNSSTASATIAKAYLAKVLFQENKYQEAYDMANAVLATGIQADSVQYRFSDNTHTANSGGIFSLTYLPFGTSSNDSPFTFDIAKRYAPPSLTASPDLQVVQAVYDLLGTTDTLRKKAWFKSAGKYFTLKKYPTDGHHFMNAVHWAEIILISAESAVETGQTATGLAALNELRTKRSLVALGNSLSAADLIRTIRDERRLELVGEGNRIQDLKRIGAASARGLTKASDSPKVRSAPWDCPGMLLQISSAEMAASSNYPPNPTGSCN